MTAVVLVSGWGHRETALRALGRLAAGAGSVKLVGVHSLAGQVIAAESQPAIVSIPSAPGTASTYAWGLASFLKREEAPSVLIGWSMGGIVCLETALRYPSLVDRLVLINSTPCFCRRTGFPHGVRESALCGMVQRLAEDPLPTLNLFLRSVYPLDTEEDYLNRQLEEAQSIPRVELIRGLEYLRHIDLRDRLAELVVPALVLQGKCDRVIPWQAGCFLGQNLPFVRTIFVEGMEHAVSSRKVPAWAEDLKEFVTCRKLR